METQTKYIAYYRVSTDKQGIKGLGMQAQQSEVSRFTAGNIIAEYTEVESGKRSDRPELTKALKHCRAIGATLVIAKLDRLSRNVQFISTLMNSGTAFVACDMPHADKFTIHIFAALAEKEREMTSIRVKAALAAKKAAGFKLGCHTHKDTSPDTIRAHCDNMRLKRTIKPVDPAILLTMHEFKGCSLAKIAAELNKKGLLTSKGCTFTPVQVFRLQRRFS